MFFCVGIRSAELCIYHFRRHTVYCFSICAKPLKNNIIGFFCRFFLAELSKSRSLKSNISGMAWPILMILVSFYRTLNSLSDEMNLFWCCISPLTFQTLLKINIVCAELVLFVSRGTAVQFPLLSLEIKFNIVRFINYTIPRLF